MTESGTWTRLAVYMDGSARILAKNETDRIIAACGSDFLGLRSRIVLDLALRFGFRENEILSLNMEHVSKTQGRRRLPAYTIQIAGSEQSIEGDRHWVALLDSYLRARTEYASDEIDHQHDASPLILSQVMTRLTKRALRKSLQVLAKEASIDDLTFHVLRATFIRTIWNETRDVKKVAERARMKSQATVLRHIS